MLRFSIREILLLTLTVACLAGWWRYHVTATAERARLAQESQHFRDLISGRDMRISSLESISSLHEKLDSLRAELDALHDEEKSRLEAENSHLEAENARLERLMLDHSTQAELELKRFQKLPTGS